MTQTLSQEITAKLTRRILDNNYRSGEKLPTERELSLEFGVTRHVVREALKRLEAVGLVRIRQGSGIHVENLQLTGGIELFEILLRRDDGSVNLEVLREILEFRADIACCVVRLAAQRRTEEEMREIKRLFGSLGGVSNAHREGENTARQLFRLIVKATHNGVYELVFNTLERIFLKLRAMIDIPMMGQSEGMFFLARLVEAFEQRDGEMAELLVTRYMERMQHNLEAWFSAAS